MKTIVITILIMLVGYAGASQNMTGGNATLAAISIILFAFPSFYVHVQQNRKKGILIIATLFAYALLFETIALFTGYPYGQFTYGQEIGYKIGGILPWTVGFAWVPLLLGSVALAERITKNKYKYALSLLFLVAIDLVIDPAAVALQFWTYAHPGIYYGVPFTNYIGWIISGILGILIYFAFSPKSSIIQASSLLAIAAFWTGVAAGKSLVIPAIIGVIYCLTALFLKNKKCDTLF